MACLKYQRHKFSPLEKAHSVTIRAEKGSIQRPVSMKRVKYLFDIIDDDDSDYDDETVIIVGPDKRGVVDVKAYDIFHTEDIEYTFDFCQQREPSSWTTEEVLETLDTGQYARVYDHYKTKTGFWAHTSLTREQKIEEATLCFGTEQWTKQAAEHLGDLKLKEELRP